MQDDFDRIVSEVTDRCNDIYDYHQYEKQATKEGTIAKHYNRIGTNSFSFVDDVVDSIPSGFYRPIYDNFNNKYFIERKNVEKPRIYHLPVKIFDEILNDIHTFWNSKEVYKNFGEVYKLNFLLYSVPGNGKTCLINIIAEELMTTHDGIVITINSLSELVAYPKVIESIRRIEPDRKVLTVIEDFDGLVGTDKSAETLLLQILDGNDSVSDVITIATTNYIEQLKPSFTARPSRFRVYEYKRPMTNVRRFYIYNKLKDFGLDVDKEEHKILIDRLTEKSDGYTFDLLKELVTMIFVLGYTEDDAVQKMNEVKESNGKLNNTEDTPKKIGFVGGDTSDAEIPKLNF